MTNNKGNWLKHPAFWATVLIVVLLAIEIGAVFMFNAARDAAFLGWLQNVSADNISQARAFRHRDNNESDQIVIKLTEGEDKQVLTSLLNGVEETNIFEAPATEGGSYVLDLADLSVTDSDSEGEVLLNVMSDGKMYLTFDKETQNAFCSKGKTWWLDYPALSSYISGLVSQREAQVNVIAAMKAVKSSDFINTGELGNISAKKLASAHTKWFWEIFLGIDGDP